MTRLDSQFSDRCAACHCQDKVCLGNDLNQLCADVDVPWHRGWHGGSMWIYVLKLSQDVTGSTVVTLQVDDRIIYSSFLESGTLVALMYSL